MVVDGERLNFGAVAIQEKGVDPSNISGSQERSVIRMRCRFIQKKSIEGERTCTDVILYTS